MARPTSYAEPATVDKSDPRGRIRTGGERDRDRILYSTAFQRLAGITQVMPAGAGQAVHSRLTHSLKVAQVARRTAQRLVQHHPDVAAELDPDSVEAAALVHDLGHPPFGHIAEKRLNKFALDRGADGFEGNAQSFRLVTRLAQRWPLSDAGEEFGLNLSRRTLDGILKYPWVRNIHDKGTLLKWGAYVADEAAFNWVRHGRPAKVRSLAAEVMDWADDLTYAVHDMEDFFRAGLVPLDRLCTSQRERERFCRSFVDRDGNVHRRLSGFTRAELESAVEDIFDRLDFVDPYTGTRGQRQILRERTSFLVRDFMHAMGFEGDTLTIDPHPKREVAILKELTWFYVINRQDLATVQEGQRRIIDGLCEKFWSAATKRDRGFLFPPLEQQALREADENPYDKARLVCDFVARLTEARAHELHQRLLGSSVRVLAPPAH